VKAYRFRLTTVARVRALEARVARDRFMAAQRDVRHAQEALRHAQAALRALAPPDGSVMSSDLVWLGDQAARCAASIARDREGLAAARAAAEAARQAWTEAAKRARVLERLDEEGRVRWRADVLRHEAAELDDLAQVRQARTGAVR